MQTTSQAKISYEKKPTTRLKRHVKNVNPEYTKKRKLYSDQDQVKNRRKILNRRRRMLSSNLINLVKNSKVYFIVPEQTNGTSYKLLSIIRGRLCCNDKVLYSSKEGNITFLPYNTEVELENDTFDVELQPDNEEDFQKLLKAYEEYVKTNNGNIYDKSLLDDFLEQYNQNDRGLDGNGGKDTQSISDSNDSAPGN